MAVVIRGGGYGGEWSSNFHVGNGSDSYHIGFNTAAEAVYKQVLKKLDTIDGKIKLWVTGYSRGAATANLLAAKLDDYAAESEQLDATDIFAYTFATPQGVTNRQDTDAARYLNIFNIVNPGDVVPMVAPSGWGFTRYGVTRMFDKTADEETLDAVNLAYVVFTGNYSYSAKSDLRQSAAGAALMKIILKAFPDSQSSASVQKVLQEFLEFGNTKKYVSDGNGKGSWKAINLDDFYRILIERYGDTFFQSFQRADSFLTVSFEGKLLMERIGDDEQLSNYVYLFLTLCEIHGLDSCKLAETLTSLIGSDSIMHALAAYLNMPVGIAGVGTAHTPAVYLSWMSLDELRTFGNTSYSKAKGTTVVKVSCPVDVTVYDQTGAAVAMVKDHSILFADIPIVVSNETTELYFAPTDDQYTIEVVPNDNGQMNYTVAEMDASNTITAQYNYYDVLINEDQVFSCTFDTDTESAADKYDLVCTDETGETVITADEILTGTNPVNVTLNIEGKGSAIGGGSYVKGDTVVFRAYSMPTSKFKGWYVNGTLVSSENVFQMCVKENVVVDAVFVIDHPFRDIPVGAFYEEPVLWALDNGITTGATDTTFNPNGACLRAQVVTFLHRTKGNPVPTSNKNPFTDVKEGDFFFKPVLWAVEKGITNGISATKFGSGDVCNRAAVVTFLWRAAGSPEPKSTNNPFVDVKTTDFFYKPVLWAVENGITNGVDATHFGPATDCNRAQVVTFLYRAAKNNNKKPVPPTEPELDPGLVYEVYEDHVEITDYTGTATEIVIPARIEGLPVTVIGEDAFNRCYDIINVSIPEGVTTIGDFAFQFCSNLTTISIPDTLVTIGASAFDSCYKLTGITLPTGISHIGGSAFVNCDSLTSISIPEGIASIGNFTFYACDNLASVLIPKSVTSVGDRAFFYCNSLTAISLPEGVTFIGNEAFAWCYHLNTINFDGNAPVFGENVFDDVTGTAYYPANNFTWTTDVMQDYGGDITWVANDSGQKLV